MPIDLKSVTPINRSVRNHMRTFVVSIPEDRAYTLQELAEMFACDAETVRREAKACKAYMRVVSDGAAIPVVANPKAVAQNAS